MAFWGSNAEAVVEGWCTSSWQLSDWLVTELVLLSWNALRSSSAESVTPVWDALNIESALFVARGWDTIRSSNTVVVGFVRIAGVWLRLVTELVRLSWNTSRSTSAVVVGVTWCALERHHTVVVSTVRNTLRSSNTVSVQAVRNTNLRLLIVAHIVLDSRNTLWSSSAVVVFLSWSAPLVLDALSVV